MQESEPFVYSSEFLPNVSIAVVFEEDPQYEDLRQFFQDYGYGFMVPGKNLIIIDGEILTEDNYKILFENHKSKVLSKCS